MATKLLLAPPLTRSLATRPVSSSRYIFQQLSSKKYHSHDHPPSASQFTPIETTILTASYPYIPVHGFTYNTLTLGAKDAGYVPASVNLFPRGAMSLVEWHLELQKSRLARTAEQLGTGMGVGERVKALSWERLMGNQAVIGRWQEALALLALPTNLPTSLHHLASLSDEIWYLAGDLSVDTSWYTKRASLSTIYAATELFMTTDKSAGFEDTKEFLDRRFRDSQVVGGALGSVGEWVGFTARAGVNVLRSRGLRI